jgi:tRNA threonylcarbamoyladenosine dehydratase
LPSIFGLHIATYVLCELAGKPILQPLSVKNRRKLYEKLLRDLSARESKALEGMLQVYVSHSPAPLSDSFAQFIGHSKLPIDETDVGFIFEDLNRGRSTIPPHPILSRPILARWDNSKPLSVDNCVVISQQDERLLLQAGGKGYEVEVWSEGAIKKDVVNIVETRMSEARSWRKALSA